MTGRKAGALALFAGLLVAAAHAGAEGAPTKQKPPARSEKPAAPAPYTAQILVLHATNSQKGLDPRIGDMPELKKPPFSAYDSYELLQKAELPLHKGQPKALELANGRTLRTELLEVLANDAVRLSASVNQPNGKEFLPLLEVKARAGQHFIVAGQSYKKGILVLVIRLAK